MENKLKRMEACIIMTKMIIPEYVNIV